MIIIYFINIHFEHQVPICIVIQSKEEKTNFYNLNLSCITIQYYASKLIFKEIN